LQLKAGLLHNAYTKLTFWQVLILMFILHYCYPQACFC